MGWRARLRTLLGWFGRLAVEMGMSRHRLLKQCIYRRTFRPPPTLPPEGQELARMIDHLTDCRP
jgi:hypothetical protein